MESSLKGKRAVVVGGSRGLGRGAVEALAARGAKVSVIGRDEKTLAELTQTVRAAEAIVGDATDEKLAARVLGQAQPELLVLVAGAAPRLGALHELSWDEFQVNWNVDAKLAFVWLGAALRQPMKAGSHVIVVSSGAAVQGSPVSGGYASAKRAQWFMAGYAATEAERAKLDIRIHCLLPNLNGSTGLGRDAIAAYAKRAAVSEEEFVKRFGPPLTPPIFGAAVADLAESPANWAQPAYRVGGAGLVPLA
jgi:NAD(P)-dependent dehydrogenase (short-subunit alcohol dehydrogenase family)